MKTHSITGCEILDSLHDMGNPEYRRYAHNICHYHHERWEGENGCLMTSRVMPKQLKDQK